MKPHKSLKRLLEILGESQETFSARIGVPRQRIADLIYGRGAAIDQGELKMIAAATGADVTKPDKVTSSAPYRGRPYTKKTFEDWQRMFGRCQSEKAAQADANRGADSLFLLLLAAGSENKRLAVWTSFVQWCEKTGESFKLLPALNIQLSNRAWKKEIHKPRFQRLTISKPVPDEPGKRSFVIANPDQPFNKTGEKEFVPLWRPGSDMRPTAPEFLRRLVTVERRPTKLRR